MIVKRIGLILLLIATTGFGFHKWYFDNKIDSFITNINDRVAARTRYTDGIMRFRDLKQEWQVKSLAVNIGQLFKRSDLLLYKQIRDASIQGVIATRENIIATKRMALIELAYNVDGKAYSEEIGMRFDAIIDVEIPAEPNNMTEIALKTSELKDDIVSRLQRKIEVL